MDPKDIRSRFRVKLGIQLVCIVPVIGLFFRALNEPGSVSPFVVVGSALIPILVGFFNWRCPSCKAFLGRNLLQFRCRSCNAGLLE
jgi:hypothetical protein